VGIHRSRDPAETQQDCAALRAAAREETHLFFNRGPKSLDEGQ
jgi:hypothetical protein